MAKCMCFHLATLCLNNYREDILKITPALSKNIINEEPSEEKLISATTVRMHPREITLLDSLIRWGIVPAPSRAQFFFEAFLQQLRLLDDIIKKFEDITGSRREASMKDFTAVMGKVECLKDIPSLYVPVSNVILQVHLLSKNEDFWRLIDEVRGYLKTKGGRAE